MRHLVTGGSGYLGSLIVSRLLARGDDVRVLDLWVDPALPAAVEVVEGDVRDAGAVAAAMDGVDVVHHNAALVPLAKAGGQFWEVNVVGSRVVAEAARREGVSAFVHMSSSAIFAGQDQRPITPTTPPVSVEAYGASKWLGEQAVREVLEGSGCAVVDVRPRTILGPGRLGIFGILFSWIAEGRDVYTLGPGDGPFQFVHADDLMSAYLLALDAGRPGVLNVGTDRFGTLREALEHLIEHAGTSSRVRALPERASAWALRTLDVAGLSPLAPYHYHAYQRPFWFDVAPLHAMGWRAEHSNDEMLAASYDRFLLEGAGTQGDSPHRKPVPERALRLLRRLS